MKCWYCETELVWNNDYSFDELDYEGKGYVVAYSCQKCNAEYEVTRPTIEKER